MVDDLREALAKHAECWDGDSADPSVVASVVEKAATMGLESTALH